MECGRDRAGLDTMTRAEFYGIRREWFEVTQSYRAAGMTVPASLARPNVCLTCWETANRWSTWEHNPSDALYRELDELGWRRSYGRHDPSVAAANRTLWALAELARLLPEQFERLRAQFTDGYRRPDPYD